MVYIETRFYLKHHILDEILICVFRQFMKGMCQKNQLKIAERVSIYGIPVGEIWVMIMYIFSTFKFF